MPQSSPLTGLMSFTPEISERSSWPLLRLAIEVTSIEKRPMVAFNTQPSHLTLGIPETKEWDAIDSTLQPREKGCGFYQESDESRGDVAFVNGLDLLRIYI